MRAQIQKKVQLILVLISIQKKKKNVELILVLESVKGPFGMVANAQLFLSEYEKVGLLFVWQFIIETWACLFVSWTATLIQLGF